MNTNNPLFQHRHYREIARIIANYGTSKEQRDEIAEHFAESLRGTNAKYSAARFYDAATGNPANRDRVN
jgi:hypothetical protein